MVMIHGFIILLFSIFGTAMRAELKDNPLCRFCFIHLIGSPSVIDKYIFHVFRLGGALQTPPYLNSLPVIDASETAHDIPDVEPPSVTLPPLQEPNFSDTLDVNS